MNLLKFEYINWRGEHHTYLVDVEGFEYGPYEAGGHSRDGSKRFVMHAHVIERDGAARPGRRTFLLTGLMNVEERPPQAEEWRFGPSLVDAALYNELRQVNERVLRGVHSLNSSLPFTAPEAVYDQLRAKLAPALSELETWLEQHPQPQEED